MRVSINMAMSMDGKIATKARGPMKLGTELDSKRMSEIRAEHDAVINGAGTFRVYPVPLRVKDPALVKKRVRRGMRAQPISAVVSSGLKIPRHSPWEKATDFERWIFCGRQASRVAARSLEKSGVRVIRGKALSPRPREILRAFRKAGVRRILLEGGGEFNASFLEAGLVDTIHLTLTPCVIGGRESPTWCEGKGFPRLFPRFHLVECRVKGNEIYLTYAKP